MRRNPVEDNFVTRSVLGFAVIFAMMLGGAAVGTAAGPIAPPYSRWFGVAAGALLVFVGFAVAYTRYDAAFGPER